jgi:iron(III) transport system permease protein
MFAQDLIGLEAGTPTCLNRPGPLPRRRVGVGAIICGVLAFIFSSGLALNGLMRGDGFLVSSIAVVASCIGVFVSYPVFLVLIEAAITPEGSYSLTAFLARVFSADVGQVTLNSLALGIATGLTTTLLGLGLALLHKRTNFRAKGLLRLLAILPIITPPFVIGLGYSAVRAKRVGTWLISELFGIADRWIYGFFACCWSRHWPLRPLPIW